MTDTCRLIAERLTAVLSALEVAVEDASGRHAGHAEARQSGGGHYRVRVVSAQFTGKDLLARHRMVYDALRDEMGKDIHALKIEALAPEETILEKPFL